MYLVRKIVVGVEMPAAESWNVEHLEAPSQLAVRQAFQLAHAVGIPVTLVTVLPEPATSWFSSATHAEAELQKLNSDAQSLLQTLAQQYSATTTGSIETQCVVTKGRPWFELLRVSGNAADTMIVCGTRNAGAVSRALFGSTGMKLLRNASGPVWLVKPGQEMEPTLNILAATDLSEVGLDILHSAVSLARSRPSQLHVLHVVEGTVERYLRRTGISPEQLAEMRQKSRVEAEHAVHDQLAKTDFRTLESGVQVHIADGPADAVILDAIDDLKINVLVLATKGRGGVAGMLVGNTAEKLLPEIPCSIIAIKPDDFSSPVEFPE